MSTNNITATAPSLSGFSPLGSLRGLLANYRAWRQRRDVYLGTLRELSMLSDRDLADLGLSRADFHYLATQEARKI